MGCNHCKPPADTAKRASFWGALIGTAKEIGINRDQFEKDISKAMDMWDEINEKKDGRK